MIVIRLELVYKTEKEVSVKSRRMRDLDEDLGDLRMQIIDKESIITMRFLNF